TAARKALISVLMSFRTARLRSRRFLFWRSRFLAVLVCGIARPSYRVAMKVNSNSYYRANSQIYQARPRVVRRFVRHSLRECLSARGASGLPSETEALPASGLLGCVRLLHSCRPFV